MSELVPVYDRTYHEVFYKGLHFVLIFLLPIKPYKDDASFLIPKGCTCELKEMNGMDLISLYQTEIVSSQYITYTVIHTKEGQSHTPSTLFSNLLMDVVLL